MPDRPPNAASKIRSNGIGEALAGWEQSFAEQEYGIWPGRVSMLNFSPPDHQGHPALIFEFGELNLLDRRVVLKAGADQQSRQEHGRNKVSYIRRLSHHVLAAEIISNEKVRPM